MSKRTVSFIILSQGWFAFMILMIKYMINGFSNVTGSDVAKDLLFMIPSTIYIIALTIVLVSGIIGLHMKIDGLIKTKKKA